MTAESLTTPGQGAEYADTASEAYRAALRSGGLVAASDIPVHRDVFADACAYFDPYSVDGMAEVLIGLLEGADGPPVRALRERGAEVGARYVPERVMPMWAEFLERVMREGPPAAPHR